MPSRSNRIHACSKSSLALVLNSILTLILPNDVTSSAIVTGSFIQLMTLISNLMIILAHAFWFSLCKRFNIYEFRILGLVINTLALISVIYYCNLTFRGYGILPYIKSPQKFLLPIPVVTILLVFMSFMKISVWNILITFLTIWIKIF